MLQGKSIFIVITKTKRKPQYSSTLTYHLNQQNVYSDSYSCYSFNIIISKLCNLNDIAKYSYCTLIIGCKTSFTWISSQTDFSSSNSFNSELILNIIYYFLCIKNLVVLMQLTKGAGLEITAGGSTDNVQPVHGTSQSNLSLCWPF